MTNGQTKATAADFSFHGINHIQLAAPPGCEEAARAFFVGILGWSELPKPKELRARGGVWFLCGRHQVHIGVQTDFTPATKAHPAFEVTHLDALRSHMTHHDIPYMDDFARETEGADRFYISDPFGNRLEFIEWTKNPRDRA